MKLLDRTRFALRARRYSLTTEKSYLAWIRRYILFHGKRHPAAVGAQGVAQYLSHKYPSVAVDMGWQFIFPASRRAARSTRRAPGSDSPTIGRAQPQR